MALHPRRLYLHTRLHTKPEISHTNIETSKRSRYQRRKEIIGGGKEEEEEERLREMWAYF
jgi:hypothetical protein